MKYFRKLVILSHRYLGIAISLLVMVWFASGIVMMYAGGMPRLTQAVRLDRLADIDFSLVRVSAGDAARQARETTAVRGGRGGARGGTARLNMVLGRPVYQVAGTSVFADTGEVMPVLDAENARRVASAFARTPEPQVRDLGEITEPDQWTLGQARGLPLRKFGIDDGLGTELYVQPRTGDVVTMTTRTSRTLAWLGVIPHWLYFSLLRTNQPLWYQTVVWTSAAACVLTVLGLILAVTQFRRVRPFRLSKAIPYAGWMRWHYITGVVFGLTALTWAFSGLLSMEPFAWTNATGLETPRDLFTGGPVDLEAFPEVNADRWQQVLDSRRAKEVEFARIQDEPYFVVHQAPLDDVDVRRAERLHQPYGVSGRADQDRLLVAARTLTPRRARFETSSILARLKSAFPDVPIVVAELLTEYDAYYYSRGRQTPLPVLRVKFADPAETWVYVDPEMSQVVAEVHRLARVERWLYNGLHSLDFPGFYDRRPLWDIVMLVLLVGGFISSGLGLFLGIRRLRRGVARQQAAAQALRDAHV